MTLSQFVSYLNEHGMIDTAKLKDNSDEGFENRLKTQKYVYLARRFGLDLGYRHNIHLYGPYSPDLTKDYYRMDVANMPSALPHALNDSEFLSALRGKSSAWLEIAATIIYERDLNQGIPLEHLYLMKPDHAPEFIDSVHVDLKNLNLL